MLAFIARLLGGGIADQLRRAYEAKLNAQNDEQRIAAEIQIAQLTARQSSLNRGGIVTALMQAAFAAPFAIYNAKILLFDKVLAMGKTDPLSAELYQIEMAVIGFYFLTAGLASLRR
jgi:hypothetical protein